MTAVVPSWLVDTCTGLGAASLTFTGLLLALCAVKAVQDRRARKAPVKGWDLEPWVEFPPYAERSCHPHNVDIDCGRRVLMHVGSGRLAEHDVIVVAVA